MKFLLSKLVNVSHSEAGIRCANLFSLLKQKGTRERESEKKVKRKKTRNRRRKGRHSHMMTCEIPRLDDRVTFPARNSLAEYFR